MNLRLVASCGLVCAAFLMSGCDEGRPAPGRVTVQVANAAPGFGSLVFRREQDTQRDSEMLFKDAQLFVYDADTYDFYVLERTLSDADPGRTWTFAPKLEASTSIYTFALTEVAGEIQPVVIATPPPSPTEAQIVALNAAGSLPAMDVYLERAGVGIAGATPRATLNAQGQISPRTLPAGDYELFLTAAGNPADVWLTSQQFALQANTTSTFIIVAESGQSTAKASALLLQAVPQVLFDRNAPAELRAINAATDQAPRDLAVNSQFSPPLHSAIPFAEPTTYGTVPVGTVKVNVTPVGNPGVLETDTQFNAVIGQRVTTLFTGDAGTLLPIFAADDYRRINREAKLRFNNGATQFLAIDFVVTFPGADPTQFGPLATLFPPGVSDYQPFYPGDYDLYLVNPTTRTILSGPTRISMAAGGIYGALAVNGPDTATATVKLLDDFP